ncbi:DUF3459 domain-containing protein [Streptomyces sp. NPDC057543]|uniref:DUF3459 domain-containing protein n=1 Tax=Streptomyces sp. NPDC057543 TaxID=3346163 RepID=UPI0036B0383A
MRTEVRDTGQHASAGGFGTGFSRLPQPEGRGALSVEARTGDPDSTLELYRGALAVRRAHPGLGAGEAVEWTDAPAGVLVFRRLGFVCTLNTTDGAVRIPAPGRLLLAGSPVGRTNGSHSASFGPAANTTGWWTV